MKKREDKSPRVTQRDKFKGPLTLKPFVWTDKQNEFIKKVLDKQTRIMFVSGPAGSTKTILATYCALELINQHRLSDIIYIRSAVESADSKIGYLPGEVDDKMAYYGIPFYDKLNELLPQDDVRALVKDNRVEIMPVNFIRGQSWNARVAIVDEAQNMTEKEIYTVLTRVGKFSKAYVLADPTQSDINGKSGGFERLRDHFCDTEGEKNGVFRFDLQEQDIMRDDLVKFLVRRYAMIPKAKK